MSLTHEVFGVVLHIDEARAPLARGQEIPGRIIEMVPLSLPPADRQGVLEPEKNAYPFLHGRTLYVSPRYRGKEWDFFRESNEIVVNVSLLDSENNEVAAGIGTLRRAK